LAAILAVKRSNLVLVSAGNMDGKELRQPSTDTTVHDFDWANNGQMMIANSTGLNLLDPESGQQTLVSKKEALFLSTCGNGRTLAFSSVGESDGTVSVWRINLNGEGLNRRTKGRFDSLVGCSHRSPWMIYWDSSAEKLKRISIEDGTLEREYQQIPTPAGFVQVPL
jgi:hypothetical protein